jgi:large subunit ribosomal protein L24
MLKFKIRKKDKVMLLSGRDKGKTGEVLRIYPIEGRLLVGKINIVTKHRKARQNEPAGIQKMEAPVPIAKVMLVCPKCEKPIRAKLSSLQTGEIIRICRKCGETIL